MRSVIIDQIAPDTGDRSSKNLYCVQQIDFGHASRFCPTIQFLIARLPQVVSFLRQAFH